MSRAQKTKLELSDRDRAFLSGEAGECLRFAAQMVVKAAEIMGAKRLIDVSFVHVDACHYYGQAHVDFASGLNIMARYYA